MKKITTLFQFFSALTKSTSQTSTCPQTLSIHWYSIDTEVNLSTLNLAGCSHALPINSKYLTSLLQAIELLVLMLFYM